MDQQDFPIGSFGFGFGGIKDNARQEKGTIKVDPYLVQEELATTIFAHRTILSKTNLSDELRLAYIASTEQQDEEVVKKTGRDIAKMRLNGERKAAHFLDEHSDQQALQNLKANLKDMLAKVESLEKTVVNAEDQGEYDHEEANRIGTPGLRRSTRNGRGTKRKQEVEELWRQATDVHKVARTMKDEGRLS